MDGTSPSNKRRAIGSPGPGLTVGRQLGATGTYNMSGGKLAINGANNDFLTIGESSKAKGFMNLNGNAEVTTPNLAIGRFPASAEGTLSIMNWGNTAEPLGNTTVPEPSGVCLTILGAIGILRAKSIV